MRRSKTTRRHFLRGAGGATLALPLLSSLSEPSRAQDSAFPKRFITMYIPNGNIVLPDGMEFDGTMLAPLTPFKDKLLLLSGVDMRVHDEGPGEPHQQGMAWLTGRPLNRGNFRGGNGDSAGWASGISVDQHIAKLVGTTTPRESLQLGVQTTLYKGTEVRTVMSYAGADKPLSNQNDPSALFENLFADLDGGDAAAAGRLEKLQARRRSVLDAVSRQYSTLTPKLGVEDRLKVEHHLTSLRDVESRLGNAATPAAGCTKPELPGKMNLKDSANFADIGRMQTDIMVAALRCDLTRVATLQWSGAANKRPYPWLGIGGDEHGLGHQSDSNTGTWKKLNTIREWYMEQLAYLMAELDSVPEGNGTMLDNTIIMLGSEVARGNSHSHANAPFILGGSAGGYFSTGQHLRFEGETPHNKLLVALLNAMGDDTDSFGTPEFNSGPLPGLT